VAGENACCTNKGKKDKGRLKVSFIEAMKKQNTQVRGRTWGGRSARGRGQQQKGDGAWFSDTTRNRGGFGGGGGKRATL